MDEDIARLARLVVTRARANDALLVTAESCTGGLVAAALTDIAGSSDVFERGYVTYSNRAKEDALGVSPEVIDRHGAVSAECASAMAEGALRASKATLGVSITGIAGPGGGSPDKPVGLVHFAAISADGAVDRIECRFGDLGRQGVRQAATRQALIMLIEMLDRDQTATA